MKMNHTNFVSASKAVVTDLALLLSSYQDIEKDTSATHEELKLLDDRFGEVLGRMSDVVAFAGKAKLTADMVTDSLKSGLELTGAIIREKNRILRATLSRASTFKVDDYVSLN